MINLAVKEISHSWVRYVLTAVGLGLLIGVTLTMTGLVRGMLDDAIALTPKVMNAGITPVCVEFMDNASIKQVEIFLDEKLPKSENGNYIIIQIAGDNEDVLMDQCEKIVELAEDNNAIDSLVADPAVIWKSRKAYLEADRARSLVFSMEDIVVPMT